MEKQDYFIILLAIVFIFALESFRRRLKPNQNLLLDGILFILCAGMSIWTLFVRYPEFVSPAAVVLRLLPAVAGVWLLALPRSFDPHDQEMEYRARALGVASLFVAGFSFTLSVWAQWGIFLIGAPCLYLLHRALGIPDYSGGSMLSKLEDKQRSAGKYANPEIQGISDKLEEKPDQTDEKKD